MVKRLMTGLLVASLLMVWGLPEADAYDRRLRRSVENLHSCEQYFPGTGDPGTPDPCYGAESVTDTLYGWDGTKALCKMTGRVICIPENNGLICSDSESESVLTTASFSDTATFDVKTAADLTVLDQQAGQDVCDFEYPPDDSTTFAKFWPNVFLAHSFYTGDFTNLYTEGESPVTTYELFEVCTIQTDDPEYDCVTLWDSVNGSDGLPGIGGEPMPHLPCCGVSNELTVNVSGEGTVTSEYNGSTIIDCGSDGLPDCDETFDGTSEPIDACPEVELTATSRLGIDVTWEECPYPDANTCTVTPPADVKAYFNIPGDRLYVVVEGEGSVWIKEPQKGYFTDPDAQYCTDVCYIDIEPFKDKYGDLQEIVLKRVGDFDSWSGIVGCEEGINNNNLTCTIKTDLTDGQIATATFNP